jgi:hypothetical protein
MVFYLYEKGIHKNKLRLFLENEMLQIKEIKSFSECDWDNFVETFPFGTIYHTKAYLNFFSNTYNLDKKLFTFYENRNLVGIFPIFEIFKGPIKIAGSPLKISIPYLGPLIPEHYLEELFLAIQKILDSEGIKQTFTTFSFSVSTKEWINKINNSKFILNEEYKTYVIDLSKGKDKLWTLLSSSCRRSVKKAKKSNITILYQDMRENVNDILNLAKKVYRRTNRTPAFTDKFYMNMFSELYPNYMESFILKYEEKIIATCIFLKFNKKIYIVDALGDPDYFHLRINNLIYWEIIEWGIKNNYETFDLTGANTPGISNFKAGFGGDLKIYPAVKVYSSRSLFYIETIYLKLRKFHNYMIPKTK